MKTSKDKQSPSVPRGLLLTALALIAVLQIIHTFNTSTPDNNSPELAIKKPVTD